MFEYIQGAIIGENAIDIRSWLNLKRQVPYLAQYLVFVKISQKSHLFIPVNHPAARGRLPRNGPISRRAYASRAGGYNLPRSDFSPSKSPTVKIYAKCHVNGRYFLGL